MTEIEIFATANVVVGLRGTFQSGVIAVSGDVSGTPADSAISATGFDILMASDPFDETSSYVGFASTSSGASAGAGDPTNIVTELPPAANYKVIVLALRFTNGALTFLQSFELCYSP